MKSRKLIKPPRWYVLYTKSRSEKRVAQQLDLMGIHNYCPVRRELRQWSDRKKKVDVPVLPSMVLVRLPETERGRVFECPNAIRYLYWDGAAAVVRDEEVVALRESLEQGVVLEHEITQLVPGARIDLSDYGFEAQEGTIKYVSGNYCWIVMESLGFVVKLKLGK